MAASTLPPERPPANAAGLARRTVRDVPNGLAEGAVWLNHSWLTVSKKLLMSAPMIQPKFVREMPTANAYQRLVLATPGPESIRAAADARLEDCVEHCHDVPLNNLVLQRRNPQLDWGQTQAWIT